MATTGWSQLVSPFSANANVNNIVNTAAVTYNYNLPFQNYVTFCFDQTQATGAATNASALSSLQQQCVRNALDYVHSVTGINFLEIPGSPSQPQELVFVYADNTGVDVNGNTAPEGVFREYPAVGTDAGGNIATLLIKNTIAFNNQYDYMNNLQAGGKGYQQLLQGVAMALGLKSPDIGALPSGMDTNATTLMSENYNGTAYAAYQTLDLQALNWLYGGDGLRGRYGLTVDANASPVAGGFNPLWPVPSGAAAMAAQS
jgi:serralysin